MEKELCELCMWEKSIEILRVVYIEGERHLICDDCAQVIEDAPYADQSQEVE